MLICMNSLHMGRFQMTVMNQRALTWGSADGRGDQHSPADIPVKMHRWRMLLCIVGIGNVSSHNPSFITLINMDTYKNGPPSKERNSYYYSSHGGGR